LSIRHHLRIGTRRNSTETRIFLIIIAKAIVIQIYFYISDQLHLAVFNKPLLLPRVTDCHPSTSFPPLIKWEKKEPEILPKKRTQNQLIAPLTTFPGNYVIF